MRETRHNTLNYRFHTSSIQSTIADLERLGIDPVPYLQEWFLKEKQKTSPVAETKEMFEIF